MIQVDASEVDRLNRNLQAYVALSGRAADEVVRKKGEDLRIQLAREFFRQRWKGGRGVAWREFKGRVRAGEGTLVRLKSVSSRFLAASGKELPATDTRGRPLSSWQQLVWQEIARRQHGVGALGATFLVHRWQHSGGERKLVANRSRLTGSYHKRALDIVLRDGAYTLEAKTPGIAAVGSRYGLITKALASVNADTEKYLTRKMEEAAKLALPQ
jgi:hypothetical protein